MTNLILLFYASLFACVIWVLAALVNRWSEDNQKLNDISKKVDDHVSQVKGLEEDLDDLWARFYQLRDYVDHIAGEGKTNDEAAANAILNIRNDISKLRIRVSKLEGKETK